MDDDALRDITTVDNFLRGSYRRTADVFDKMTRPLTRSLRRWSASDNPRKRLLYEGAGIAVYAIAYLAVLALFIVGGFNVGPDLPGDDASGSSSSEGSPPGRK